ncbi:MAG: hypothetical protein HRU38_24125 [Saccharospirillaceae bacterium]|nr:hypothetical protein [Pseudomonadales bacterium]NRB81710.1 hypothetical protein [Saccharospirillaceae bacterium]
MLQPQKAYWDYSVCQYSSVLMHGQNIPTDVYIESTAPMILYAVPVFIVVGLVNYFIFKKRERKEARGRV